MPEMHADSPNDTSMPSMRPQLVFPLLPLQPHEEGHRYSRPAKVLWQVVEVFLEAYQQHSFLLIGTVAAIPPRLPIFSRPSGRPSRDGHFGVKGKLEEVMIRPRGASSAIDVTISYGLNRSKCHSTISVSRYIWEINRLGVFSAVRVWYQLGRSLSSL
jgi:hypothetical protein